MSAASTIAGTGRTTAGITGSAGIIVAGILASITGTADSAAGGKRRFGRGKTSVISFTNS